MVYYLLGYKHNCSDLVVPSCQGIPGYTKTVVSKDVQLKYSDWIRRKIDYDSKDNCSKPRKEIVCAENLPACVDNTAAFLCRDSCLKFFNTCTSPFFYGKDMCMEFPERGADTPKDSVICKQSHWPRSENWQLSEKPTSKTGKTRLLSRLFACFNICKLWFRKKKHSMFLLCKANIRVFFCECVFCLHPDLCMSIRTAMKQTF